MKLLRKLAIEHQALNFSRDLTRLIPVNVIGNARREGFEAGFMKARFMAAHKMGEMHPYPDGKGLQLPAIISAIGEEEVNE